MVAAANKLTGGVYTLAEVSRLTRLAPSTLRTWFKGRSDGIGNRSVFSSDYEPIDGDFAVSFLDLIEVYVAGQFRNEGVRMAVIRNAHHKLKSEFEVSHPFALESLYTDGHEVIRKTAEPALISVSDKQHWFLEFESKLKRIDYSSTTQLACQWNIADGIVLDPRIHRGKPVIKMTGISTRIIARQYIANDRDAGLVAHLFQIGESDVAHAVSFEEGHGSLRAA